MQKKHVDPVTLKAGRCDAKSPETCPKMASVPPNKREQYHFEDDGNPAAVAVAMDRVAQASVIPNIAKKIVQPDYEHYDQLPTTLSEQTLEGLQASSKLAKERCVAIPVQFTDLHPTLDQGDEVLVGKTDSPVRSVHGAYSEFMYAMPDGSFVLVCQETGYDTTSPDHRSGNKLTFSQEYVRFASANDVWSAHAPVAEGDLSDIEDSDLIYPGATQSLAANGQYNAAELSEESMDRFTEPHISAYIGWLRSAERVPTAFFKNPEIVNSDNVHLRQALESSPEFHG